MWIPIGLLSIILFIVGFYIEKIKIDKQKEVREAKEQANEEARKKAWLDWNSKQQQKETDDISFIVEILSIDNSTAKEFYSFLNRKDKFEVFRYSETKQRQLELYQDFLQEKKELEKFKEMVSPIIEEENLGDLNLESLFYYRNEELFSLYNDITLREKLKQFNSDYNSNILLLVEILKPIFPNFEYDQYVSIIKEKSNFCIKDRLEILFDDIYRIIEFFNNYFDLSIKNINEINLSDFYFFKESHIYKEWHWILQEIFLVCLFESHLLPENIKIENIRDYEYKSAFDLYCCELFFYKPYYSIIDCKQILLKHVEDLKSKQKYQIESR